MRSIVVFAALAVILGLPFLLRPAHPPVPEGTLRLVVVSPHGEAIRYEFQQGFSRWHQRQFGQAVQIEYRSIGGTTEIARYLDAQMLASFRQYWTQTLGRPWTEKIGRAAQDYRLNPEAAAPEEWEVRQTYLDDEQTPLDCGVDVFFGGGPYDHNREAILGNTARAHIADDRPDLLINIPQNFRGEDYYPAEKDRGRPNRAFDRWYGTTLSSFGFCVNQDRLAELALPVPMGWNDLTDPRLFGQVAAADPTKSATITKCFEMMIQQQIWIHLAREGITPDSYDAQAKTRPDVVAFAQKAGWRQGLQIIRLVGANARYFADSSSKVPIDVAEGNSAVGMCVGFYGLFQSEFAGMSGDRPRMIYLHPVDGESGIGGSSLNADPVSLMRMDPKADPERPYRIELARRFMQFCLEMESQKLWGFRAGEPGGPEKYTLRRIAVRRDFYTPENLSHMADPEFQPYVGGAFLHYRQEWTSPLFNPLRLLIKGTCIDTADELRAAWGAILEAGGEAACPEAMAILNELPRFEVNADQGAPVAVSLEYGAGMDAFTSLMKMGAEVQLRLTEGLALACREQYRRAREAAKK